MAAKDRVSWLAFMSIMGNGCGLEEPILGMLNWKICKACKKDAVGAQPAGFF